MLAVIALTAAALARSPVAAASPGAPVAGKATASRTPVRLDARLRAYKYPYPVAFQRSTAQGQLLEMAYMDVAPSGPARGTVLLLHGKNFSGAYWGSTIAALVADGYRVIAPDQIGFGKSTKPRHFQYSFHALAAITRDLLDRLGAREVVVVGHSMGGMLAVRFALSYPDRTAKLVLVNPIGLEDWKRWVPYTPISQLAEREKKRRPADIKEYMRKSYFGGKWKPSYDPLLELQAGWAVGPDRDLLAWTSALTSDMVFTQPVVHELGDLRVPTLLIIGQRDRTAVGKDQAPPAVAAKLGDYPALGKHAAAAIPGAELVELDGVGHVPQVEAFDRTMAPLRRFLAAPAAARRSPPR
jgi:pimeloyl-ACP methyl ester carboxylesterase